MKHRIPNLRIMMILMGTLSLLTSCAVRPVAKEDPQVRRLEEQLKQARKTIEDLKEKNLVLSVKRTNSHKAAGGVFGEVVSKAVPPSPSLPSRIVEPIPNATPSFSAVAPGTAEALLYSKVLESFRTRQLVELEKATQMLRKTYRDSVYNDNALWLSANLLAQSGENAKALARIDEILREFPTGGKAVGALFLKAKVLAQEKRIPEAIHVFEQVRQRYPGSPESFRVITEMKMLGLNKGKQL